MFARVLTKVSCACRSTRRHLAVCHKAILKAILDTQDMRAHSEFWTPREILDTQEFPGLSGHPGMSAGMSGASLEFGK